MLSNLAFPPFMRRNRKLLKWLGITVYIVAFTVSFLEVETNSRIRRTMPDWGKDSKTREADILQNLCTVDFENLGVTHVDLNVPEISEVEAENHGLVEMGGKWSPSDCVPRQEVAILIPYRDRWEHLKVLLRRLHPMLRLQKISYHIILIEQAGNDTYNKGILYNAGVIEALKLHPFTCFIFHDVDLLPENDKNIYHCDNHLRHFSPAIDEWRYVLLYTNNAGGVVALSRENIFRINGFSNSYWGWGAEDDDFSARALEAGLLLTRPPKNVGRYKMVRHMKRKRAGSAYSVLMSWQSRWKTDGLNFMNKTDYKLLETKKLPLYTRFLVDVGESPKSPQVFKNDDQVTSIVWFSRFFFI